MKTFYIIYKNKYQIKFSAVIVHHTLQEAWKLLQEDYKAIEKIKVVTIDEPKVINILAHGDY